MIAGNLVLEHAIPVAGFLFRPRAPNHDNYPGAVIWTGEFKSHPGKADEVEALRENLLYIESSEPETINFLVLKSRSKRCGLCIGEIYVRKCFQRCTSSKCGVYQIERKD